MAERVNPLRFFGEVRAEARKVSWPTRKETMVTTFMVLALVVVSCIFFFLVDQILGWGIRMILTLGQ